MRYSNNELEEWSKAINSPITIEACYDNLVVTLPVGDLDHMWNNNNEYDYKENQPMKILKYGEGYPKVAHCNCCHSQLEYVATDIQCTLVQMIPDVKTQEYICCPVCGTHIVVYDTSCT